MKPKTIVLTLITFVFSVSLVFSQRKLYHPKSQIGINLGTTLFLGDLGGGGKEGGFIRDTDFQTAKLAIGIDYTYYSKSYLSLSGAFNLTAVEGNDAYTSFLPRKNRGLHAKSRIFEGYTLLQGHYNISDRLIFEGGTGLGFLHFSPQSFRDGQWRKETPPRQIAAIFPVSWGLNYRVTNDWTVHLSYIGRFTSTDYMDGVDDIAQEFSEHNDFYYSFTLGVSRFIGKTPRRSR